LETPPPKQKPVTQTLPFDSAWAFSHWAQGDKILVQLWLVDPVKELTAVVVVVSDNSDGCQRIRCKGDEVLQSERRATSSVCGLSPRFS